MPLSELKNVLASDKPKGVYWLKAHANVAELARQVRAKRMAFFHLEGQRIEKKEQFFNHASVAMKFPSHFGANWDAFYDCITDFEWVDAKGYCIYFDHTDAFTQHHESQLETVIELFEDAVEFWEREGQSMLVFLSGNHPPEGMASV